MARRPVDGRSVRARSHRARRRMAAGIAGFGALLGAAAPVAPAGLLVTDRLLAALAAGAFTYAGRRARRWTLVVPAAAGAVLAGDPVGLVCGLAALAAATAAGWRRRRSSRLNMAAAALAAGALLRVDDLGFHGASALLVAAAASPVLVSAWRRARPRERRVAKQVAVAAAAVCGVAAVGAVLTLLAARGDVARGQRAFDRGVAAARAGEDGASAEALRVAAGAFEDAARGLDAWWGLPGRALPVLGHNLRAIAVAADVAADVGGAGAELVARAGSDELAVRGGVVPVAAIGELGGPVDSALRAVRAAERRTDDVASPWLLPLVGERFDRLTDELDDARPDLELAADAVRAVPRLLGSEGPRRYLAVFVTPVEARATGFPGNFAELVVDGGRLEMTRFGRITELERATDPEDRTLQMPPEYHARYDRFRPTQFFRNLTATPDFPTAAEAFRQLYPQSGGTPVDGVLAVDPTAIAAILRLTGPVNVPELDEPLTADNAERFLLRDQYLDLPDRPDRIDALETLGQVAFERLVSGDLPAPPDIADVLAPVADAGHLRLVSFDGDDNAFLDHVDITGRLVPVGEGDSLAVTNNNAVGGKIDLFLERDIAYDVEWDPASGDVRAVATVTLTNTTPTDAGLPEYVVTNTLSGEGADLPVGTNRTYLSIFTPWALDGATLDGTPLATETHTEGGRAVYSAVVDVAPDGGTATLRFELSGRLAGGYRLDLWPQLLPTPDHVTVNVDASSPLSDPEGFQVDGTRAVADLRLRAPATLAVTSASVRDA